MKGCATVLLAVSMLGIAALASADEKSKDDPFGSLLNAFFSLPVQITYHLFSPIEADDTSTAYRKAGFSQKDQDYFQLNWYGEQRLGYSSLFERKELDEEIARETYGPFRDR